MKKWLGLFMPYRETLLACVAMLGSIVVLAGLQYVALDQRFRHELQTQARIVAQNTGAALLFDAPADAQEVLSALGASPAVMGAQLLRADGSGFSYYERPARPRGLLSRWAGIETVQAPVSVAGRDIGTLVVHAERETIGLDTAKFLAGGLGISAIALGLSFVASRRLRERVRAAQERTRYLALHDALTGLPNRTSFQEALETAVVRAKAGQAQYGLMFVDIDNFKQINDTSGHTGGDRVLCEVARRLRALLRPGDIVARLGGDEFAVLVESDGDASEAAARVARDITQQVPRRIEFEGEHLRVSVSVGVALVPHDARNAGDAMQCADAAMYQAKREGKDAFRFFSAELGAEIRRRAALEADLRSGIESGQFLLHYQPVFDGRGRLAGTEALMRWAHPQRGMVSPAEFIPLAESSGLIVELGLAGLRRVARDIEAWEAAGLQPPPVALNLASAQFRRESHRRRFLAALDELGLVPQRVEFELTETAVFEDTGGRDSILEALRERGYALAIDDFGTGYSSLSYLRRLRCRKLKIDKSFVRDICTSRVAALLVRSIIDVAHALHMRVVAEGVETGAEREKLLSLGCDLLQGYLLARPMPPEAMATLLEQLAPPTRGEIGTEAGDAAKEPPAGLTTPAA
ncbi:MAG TPA: EAL domain-containing protein [Burkholderiaceae bacterium]|nr:EAL domain-containing protein [Burkholderiaceae bacterium]